MSQSSRITATSVGTSSIIPRRPSARPIATRPAAVTVPPPAPGQIIPPPRVTASGAPPQAPLAAPAVPTAKCPTVMIPLATAPDTEITVTRRQKQEILAQAQRAEEALPTLVIESSLLTIFSYEDLEEIAVCTVNNAAQSGANTVNDPRMSVIEDTKLCSTCHKDNIECPGHLGRIVLAYPIYHPSYLRTIVQILTCVCNSCGGLLLTREAMREKGILRASGVNRLKLLEKECKGLLCQRKPEHGIHECRPNPEYLVAKLKDSKQIMYKIPAARRGEKEGEGTKSIQEVANILNAISDEDAALMGFSHGAHPRRMILRALPVMPPIVRPPSVRDGVIWPNPITTLYIEIVKLNESLRDPKLSEKDRMEKLADLFFHIEHLIDNTDGKYAPQQNRAFESIKQLIQGKEAIIRGLLMGKRVNYSARTVLSPDPNLKFGQIRIPRIMAPVLTQNVTIAAFNREAMMKLLRDGRITHITPGRGPLQGRRIQVKEEQRREYVLQIGDKVDRWLQDGDRVLWNRQPTLHKYSMMAYEVVLSDELTIGLHLSYTTPANADF
jgi:DNA-directed RNA polymerase II subunit RPB1